jgi:hypothetical protein
LRLFTIIIISVFFVELLVFPGAIVQRSDRGVAWIEDDVVLIGIEARVAEVAAGGLQGVEKKAGGFVIDLIGEQQAQDLHEGDLDRIGIFEDRESESARAAAGAICSEADALIVKAFVKETEAVAAQGGRSALHARKG